MKAYAMTANDDKYYCRDCQLLHEGEPEEVRVVGLSYEGDADDFDFEDAVYESYVEVNGECCTGEPYGYNCFDIYPYGSTYWVCGECDAVYRDQVDAGECCQ